MSIHYRVALPNDQFIETHVCPHDKSITIISGYENSLKGTIDQSICLEIEVQNIEYIIKALTLVRDEYLSLTQNTQTK